MPNFMVPLVARFQLVLPSACFAQERLLQDLRVQLASDMSATAIQIDDPNLGRTKQVRVDLVEVVVVAFEDLSERLTVIRGSGTRHLPDDLAQRNRRRHAPRALLSSHTEWRRWCVRSRAGRLQPPEATVPLRNHWQRDSDRTPGPSAYGAPSRHCARQFEWFPPGSR